ncbi:MAG: penicillin-binding protein 2 [Calditrichaeota bacterium]|nr:penicillin-binding protein 2 [Calditrichota bacterium]
MKLYRYTLNSSRRVVFYVVIGLTTLFLVAGFYNVQVLQENVYRQKSLQNSVKVITQTPLRGLIFDREGELIVDNRPSFSVYLVPAQSTDSSIARVARILNISEKEIRKKFRRSRRFQPVKIARYVDQKDLVALQENKLLLPGVEWRVDPKRNYNVDEAFAHVLGTLGEIGENELNKDSRFEPGDMVGKKGVEKTMDEALRGSKGYKYMKVNALGQSVEEIENDQTADPYPGKDLYLTIDRRLQQYADSLIGDHRGTLVAIDTRNGEVLALATRPNYQLSWFAEAVDPEIWHNLTTDPEKPLFNRSIQATYPPGSTYKMVAAIAALNEGIVSPYWSVFCPGYYRIGRRIIRCWKGGGHGEVNLTSAIRGSCNVYFYQLGTRIGIENWNKYSLLFRFGEPTHIELDSEKGGLVPSKAYYDRVYGKDRWTAGMLANIAIGQGELLVTPVQMAQFAMMLANAGRYYQPHLTLQLVDRITGKTEKPTFPAENIPVIRPEVFSAIREGMRQVVAGGTGWRAGVYGLTGGGKTGTAQNSHGNSHAWYIGFAPFEEPEIAVALVLENGGSGGGIAAPLVGQFLRRYFYFQGKFDYAAERVYLQKLWKQKREEARMDSLRAAGVVSPEDSTVIELEN